MQTIQADFNISDLSYAGLESGDFVRTGGVIRDAVTGQIVEHLKDVVSSSEQAIKSTSKAAEIVVSKSTSLSLGKKFSVGFFIVAGVVTVGYGTYRLLTYLKKRSDEKKHEEIEKANNEIITYNPELTEYFNNMHTQSMSLSSIKKVVEFFEKFSNGDLSIEITSDEMLVIRNIIVRYTIKLCESNNISFTDKQLFLETEKTNFKELLQEVNNAVKVQEEIFVFAKR